MATILDKIIGHKIKEVEKQKLLVPTDTLLKQKRPRNHYSIKESFSKEGASGVIAEFKRRSPSKDWINKDAVAKDITLGYQTAGASAVSILTDNEFFGGSSADLISASKDLTIPILRKDFIIDEYQIIEADKMGADVILLIAACLSPKQVKSFAAKAKELGLEILLEVHNKKELKCICADITLVGVNNRDLHSFSTSLDTSLELIKLIPDSFIKVSESGIRTPDDINMLHKNGFRGFLVGESFMKSENAGAECATFINKLNNFTKVKKLVKVCGMREEGNITAIDALKPDYMGLIFYPPSPRYITDDTEIPETDAKKIGVFVNEKTDVILQKVAKYNLSAVQLHGDESPEMCKTLLNKGLEVFKAFRISAETEISEINKYKDCCTYFLYDNKSDKPGGTGKKFDWNLLTNLAPAGEFFLSGGITPDDVDYIKSVNVPNFIGVDLNSKFEIEPAIKNSLSLDIFMYKLNK